MRGGGGVVVKKMHFKSCFEISSIILCTRVHVYIAYNCPVKRNAQNAATGISTGKSDRVYLSYWDYLYGYIAYIYI